MIIPPDVVLSFSYIRGLLVYCPFLLDLYIKPQGLFYFKYKAVEPQANNFYSFII